MKNFTSLQFHDEKIKKPASAAIITPMYQTGHSFHVTWIEVKRRHGYKGDWVQERPVEQFDSSSTHQRGALGQLAVNGYGSRDAELYGFAVEGGEAVEVAGALAQAAMLTEIEIIISNRSL